MRALLSAPVPVLVLVVAAGFTLTGCRFGDARFNSTVPGRTFDPAGTVWSYIDATDDNLVAEAGNNPRVVVAMTWIIFDPTGDLNDLDGSALADYSHELKLRDALALVFDTEGSVKAGATFNSVALGDVEQGDGKLKTRVHLAPEHIEASSTYAGVKPFASQRTTNVTITSADFTAASPVVAGDVTISFARQPADPGTVREGQFTGSFRAPLVGERAAEENLALLDVNDVLGLPLQPRTP